MFSSILDRFSRILACLLLLVVIGCYRPISAPPLLSASPSASQIDQILEIGRVQEIWVDALNLAEERWRSTLLTMAQQQKFSVQQQQQFDQHIDQLIAAIEQEMVWEKIKPLYQQIYAHVFNSDEIQMLLDWQRSPAGQAYLAFTQRTRLNPELRLNPVRIAAALQQELSADELSALHKFQTSAINLKSIQVLLEITEALHLREQEIIILIAQREIPELFGPPQ